MNKVIPFKYRELEVRVIVDTQGDPWWVAKDVCDALEHSDTSMAVRALDEDEKGTKKVCTLGGDQDMVVVSESGLYTLILRSNKPQSKPFRRWVTGEVLPAIRRDGCYAVPGLADAEVDELGLVRRELASATARVSSLQEDLIDALKFKCALLERKLVVRPHQVRKPCPRWRPLSDADRDYIIRLKREGVRNVDIARRMRFSKATVRRVLRDAGFPAEWPRIVPKKGEVPHD
jgi:prophage antirepressor-like protein